MRCSSRAEASIWLDPSGVPIEKDKSGRIEDKLLPQDKSWFPKFLSSFVVPAFAPGGTYRITVKIADEGGNLVSHVRMDGAWIGSIDISQKKAYTSRAFDIATKDLATHSQSGGQFFGIHASNNGKIMIFAGGIPLKKGGKVVGAIGVSGGSGDQDHAVAEAGAAAF